MILSQLFPPDVAIGGIDIDGEYASDQLDEWYRRVDRSGVRLNLIGSVDGSVAGSDGTSESLTNRADRRILATIRASSDAILVGAESVRREGYRVPKVGCLVIVTASGQLGGHRLSSSTAAGRVLVYCPRDAVDAVEASVGRDGVEIVAMNTEHGRIPVHQLIAAMNDRGLARITCEGGPSLAAQLLAAGLVDELCLSTSAQITGSPQPLFGAVTMPPVGLELAQLLADDSSGLYARWRIRDPLSAGS